MLKRLLLFIIFQICIFCSISAQNVRPDMVASPNPAIDDVTIELMNFNSGDYTLKIYNLLGSVIWQQGQQITHNTKIIKLDVSKFRKGTYLYSIQEEPTHRIISTKRLIILRP